VKDETIKSILTKHFLMGMNMAGVKEDEANLQANIVVPQASESIKKILREYKDKKQKYWTKNLKHYSINGKNYDELEFVISQAILNELSDLDNFIEEM
jgi:hypothetical protein